MVVGKKTFTQSEHGRVKLPVQFFLTLGVIVFAAIYNILIQMILGFIEKTCKVRHWDFNTGEVKRS